MSRLAVLVAAALVVLVGALVFIQTGPDPSAAEVEAVFKRVGEGRKADEVRCDGGGRSWRCNAQRGTSTFSVQFKLGRDGSMSYDVEGPAGPYRACCAI
jgi:hypothetical protein